MPQSMINKQFLKEEDLVNDSFRLAIKIFNSGFRPNVVVGLWRGGSTVGIYVQECLQYLGVETDHIAIRTSYSGAPDYAEMVRNSGQRIRVHGTQYLLENLNVDDRLLLVDDVYGSGKTLDVVKSRLKKRLKRNMPKDTRSATIWTRVSEKRECKRKPDFSLHETSNWLVMPYELTGLTEEEIKEHKPGVAKLLRTGRNKS